MNLSNTLIYIKTTIQHQQNVNKESLIPDPGDDCQLNDKQTNVINLPPKKRYQ